MAHRTYKFDHRSNTGKTEKIEELVQTWRGASSAVQARQWRCFFEGGAFDKYLSTDEYGFEMASSKLQAVAWQVVGQLQSWISNRQHEFTVLVERSSLDEETKHQLHVINQMEAWFQNESIEMEESGETISSETRKLARKIFKRCMSLHRRPSFQNLHPLLDQRIVSLGESEKTEAFRKWVNLSTTEPYDTIDIPPENNAYFDTQGGGVKNSVQVVSKEDELSFRVFKEHDFEDQRKGYVPETQILGLDFGLRNLLASSEGDIFGRNLIERLRYYDRRINKLAKYRQKHGLPVSSEKYDERVQQLRGFLKTTINRVMNRIVEIHKPAEIVLENLDFQHQDLSPRMNRLLGWCGRSLLDEKLQKLEEEYGIQTQKVAAAYTSQSCSNCGYVDKKNRRNREDFECHYCGARRNADVNAACNIVRRRSSDANTEQPTKSMILGKQVELFAECISKFHFEDPGSHGDPADLLRQNAYFDGSVMFKWNGFAPSI